MLRPVVLVGAGADAEHRVGGIGVYRRLPELVPTVPAGAVEALNSGDAGIRRCLEVMPAIREIPRQTARHRHHDRDQRRQGRRDNRGPSRDRGARAQQMAPGQGDRRLEQRDASATTTTSTSISLPWLCAVELPRPFSSACL